MDVIVNSQKRGFPENAQLEVIHYFWGFPSRLMLMEHIWSTILLVRNPFGLLHNLRGILLRNIHIMRQGVTSRIDCRFQGLSCISSP